MSSRFKMTTVVERFRDPKTNVPKERLACGHIRTDPALYYDNETAFKIKRVFELISPTTPIKARCYKCASAPNTPSSATATEAGAERKGDNGKS